MATPWAKVQFCCDCVPFRAQVWIDKTFTKLILPKKKIDNVNWFVLNKIQNFCQHLLHRLSFSVFVCPVWHVNRKKILCFGPFLPTIKNETFNLIWLNFVEPLLSIFWAYVKLWCVRVPCRAQRWRSRKIFIDQCL